MKIVVLAGGLSDERNVSLSSGTLITEALRRKGHRVALVDLYMGLEGYDGTMEALFDAPVPEAWKKVSRQAPDLKKIKAERQWQSESYFGVGVLELCQQADIVFLALHGDEGENGKLQATFDLYGIRYTGVMIENYGDDTEAPPTRQRNIRQFQYYGGLLLRQGGELGFHGYNHQPLVLQETDYGDRYDYRQWPSADAIVAAMDELTGFQKAVLPYASGSVYVPPSNILSASGRAILGSRVPQVRTIASSYLEDGTDLPYVQEFGVAEDGVVEEPRIVSGSMVGDTYMRTAALSELNLHFVSTHFMHPDDLLDVDRGAAEGWEVYKTGLEDYLGWLTAAAPALRMQTASECAGAIQRFSALTVRLESGADAWTLRLGNFADEAWLLFRANGGTPGSVSGGELTHLTGNLYLLRADAPIVTMERKEK